MLINEFVKLTNENDYTVLLLKNDVGWAVCFYERESGFKPVFLDNEHDVRHLCFQSLDLAYEYLFSAGLSGGILFQISQCS